jgi:hypothetical protein
VSTALTLIGDADGRFIDRELSGRVCFLWVAAFLVTFLVLVALAVTPAAPFPKRPTERSTSLHDYPSRDLARIFFD